MKKRCVTIVVGAVIIVFAGATVVWPREDEPEYRGKKLSHWLDYYRANRDRGASGKEVRYIGTNALPWLVKWLQAKPPAAWRTNLAGRVKKLPSGLADRLIPLFGSREEEMQGRATIGFRLLGAEAAPAVGELSRMLQNWPENPAGIGTVWALADIGRVGFPTLLSFAVDTNKPIIARCTACAALTRERGLLSSDELRILVQALSEILTNSNYPSQMRRNAMMVTFLKLCEMPRTQALVVPTLIRLLQDSDSEAIMRATLFLPSPGVGGGRCDEGAIPALITCLDDSRADVVRLSAYALGRFGDSERRERCLSALLAQLDHPEFEVRVAVTNALRRIAPEVLTNGVNGP